MSTDLARRIARAVLPTPIRKPLADTVYRTADALRAVVRRKPRFVWAARTELVSGARRMARAGLPDAVRRPLADAAYRTRDVVRAALRALPRALRALARLRTHSAGSNARADAAWSVHRLVGLPAESARGLSSVLVKRGRVWFDSNRHLLNGSAVHTPSERVRAVFVSLGARFAERHFERHFRRLLQDRQPPAAPERPRPLVVAAIGTLGPGGAERQLVNTLVGIRRTYDVDVEVLVMYQDQDWQRFFRPALEAAGIDVRVIPPRLDLAPLGPLEDSPSGRLATGLAGQLPGQLGHVAAYVHAFLELRPDVAHLWLDEVNVKAGLAAVLAGVPRVVLSTRSLNPTHFVFWQPYMRPGYRVLLDHGQVAALNNSHTGANDYEGWLRRPAGAIRVVRNGVDFTHIGVSGDRREARLRYRAARGIPEQAFVMGGVMRFSEEKRPVLWVEAADLVAAACPGVHFLLVGDGTHRPDVDARVRASSSAARIHLPGHEQNPYDSMAAMDVLVLSSRFEGLPNVLIEAQALGLPVVSTPAGGAVETFDHGVSGWLAPVGSARELADAVIHLVQQPDAAARAGAQGRRFVEERFGLQRMIADTMSVYGVSHGRR